MTKLVLKTVVITLIAVLGACSVIFGSLVLFAPVTVADFASGMGMYKTAIYCYEKQYGKSDNIDDLAVLILKIDEQKDSEKSEKYLEIMCNRVDYAEYCNVSDSNIGGAQVSLDEFYRGKYAVALVKNGKFEIAINVAKGYASEKGYTNFNPFSVIIAELGRQLTAEQLGTLRTEINAYVNGAQGTIAQEDIMQIEQLLG